MASLVADYGSSSSNVDSDENDSDDSAQKTKDASDVNLIKTEANHFNTDDDDDDDDDDDVDDAVLHNSEKNSPILENPFRTTSNNDLKSGSSNIMSSVPASVFSNPYKEVESAQQMLLEKHVKMTPNHSHTCLNNRQICWNYRKGRCRFGHNCKFAHDSDLPTYANHNAATRSKDSNPVSSSLQAGTEKLKNDASAATQDGNETTKKTKKKKRPGLSQTLIPSKKVMKQFYSQMQQEKPWLATK